MIPRSDRVFFHIDRSPPISPRNQHATLDKSAITSGLGSIATTSIHRNVNKRSTLIKAPRKMHMHTLAPATPWPPRISRKTPGATLGDEHDEQPSPLDRKVPSTLKLGNKLEPGLPSSAPTSATLTSSASDKEVGEVHDACRREAGQPMAPKLEQREDWNASDRWGMLRSELATRAAMGSQQELPPMYPMRPAGLGQKPVYALPSYATAGSSEAAYRPSKHGAEACLATDQTDETNIYVNGLPKE